MNTLVFIIIASLASYRFWRLLALDDITWKLRRPMVESHNKFIQFLTDGLLCAWCLGWWISGAVVIPWGISQNLEAYEITVIWFAVSAGTGLLGKLENE